MLELGSSPDLSQLLPEEEPPNLWDYTEPLVTQATTLENFPNPLTNPKDCNRIHVRQSYICDPDRILSELEADRIDEILSVQRQKSIHYCESLGQVPFQLGVALINWLPKEDMNTLADELLNRWKLSHDKCDDGILMLFVIHHKEMVMKWNKSVEPFINAKVASSIYPICRHLMANEKLSIAIDECTSFVIKRITGVILPTQETPQKYISDPGYRYHYWNWLRHDYNLSIQRSIAFVVIPVVLLTLVYGFNLNHSLKHTISFVKPTSISTHSATLASVVPKFINSNGIYITNNQNEFHVSVEILHETIQLYRNELDLNDFMVDVHIEDTEDMRKLNLETRGKDSPTDILSYPEYTKYIRKDFWNNRTLFMSGEYKHMGEIYLCPAYINEIMQKDLEMNVDAPERAKRGGISERIVSIDNLNLRICYLIAHGLLHLLGYDHIKNEDYQEMLIEEDRLLDLLINSGIPHKLV
ncbi:bifunctional Modulator of levamisole receptor-1/Endoribonuclease YbeY/Metalloprotease catalytic domain superfamily [Babesia duncani]|uniref:Bifunctional Modulator of levamisole receptor-1/Endoribonuclease YbeY/Metalloprotease catalytic domain superfamily n=1 Tax=Babesia duncani TaxID=323732 RepID=A0AAD9UPT0_9APIC|nr:bifunctional Modulator of levamisole receptor-1/Endoribonuclease YbeY/Metalloprotease catalytic domain superfamily [Babesia duncani]